MARVLYTKSCQKKVVLAIEMVSNLNTNFVLEIIVDDFKVKNRSY